MTVAALLVAFLRPVDVQLAGLLTIPTTIVSAFLLARDTPLAARYLQWWRVMLVVLNLSLWTLAVIKAVWNHPGCTSC